MLKIIKGNLFYSKAKYICHQCNCVTDKSAHLAKSMFQKFPWSDIYSSRKNFVDRPLPGEEPGNIVIRGNGKDKRYVIAMLSQFYPSFPKFPDSNLDGYKVREEYFQQALDEIAKIEDLETIAFPFNIGCGAAGGNWDHYFEMIENFSSQVDGKAEVEIYKLEQ